MGMGMYITRNLLERVNSRHSVRVPEYIYMLVTPVVSFPMLSIEMCLPVAKAIGSFYKESPSHQFLSRLGSCSVCLSKAGISVLERIRSGTPLMIRVESLPPLECVFFGIG